MQISHFGSLLPDGALLPDSALLPDAAAVASSRALSAESPAERQLLRTDFCFVPFLPQCCAGASESVLHWVSDSVLHWCPCRATASRVPQVLRCTGAPCRQQTSSGGEKYSGLASNLAHLGRICKLAAAVCGISQHLLTYMRPSPLLPRRTAAQTDANLPAHLHRLPTPPPYLRRMRLSPGRGAGVGCKMRLLPGRVQISDSK